MSHQKISSYLIEEYQSSHHRKKLDAFMNECAKAGYTNNSSERALKLNNMQEPYGKFWVALDANNQNIIGIAGAHSFSEYYKDSLRTLFRACLLPRAQGIGMNKGLSKQLFGSILFSRVLPLQMQWGAQVGYRSFIITTNTEKNLDDPSGKMFKSHRILRLLAKQGIVEEIDRDKEIFGKLQSVWRISTDTFQQRLSKLL